MVFASQPSLCKLNGAPYSPADRAKVRERPCNFIGLPAITKALSAHRCKGYNKLAVHNSRWAVHSNFLAMGRATTLPT